MTALRIFLADLSHINEVNRHNLYVPLNIGFVAAYLKKRFGAEVEVSLYKDPARLLSQVKERPPAILGLGAYYWKNELNKYVAEKVKRRSPNTIVAVGGPCIDSAVDVQDRYLLMHPHYDAIIPNEGEVAFGNLVERTLGAIKDDYRRTRPMDGVVFRHPEGEIIRGSFINLSTDLATIPSPYLDGTLDEWLDGTWQPLLQTSRLCPYTCAFCVSGKDRGKLRAFPLEQVRDEIDYLARRFNGPRDSLTYICDENFGIMERDVAVADYLLDARARSGYPNRVFYYNDKRFTQISRQLQEKLGSMCYHGVCLSLQSENPDALKAMNRRNLTDEQVASALAWAKGLGFKTSTELIFGVPGETLASYCATVDKCARIGFDVVNSYNLITFDGIEMNRAKYRTEHKIETMLRPIHGSATRFDDRAVVEHEEVVTSSSTFTIVDFFEVRRLNVMLKAVYALGVERDFFERLVRSGRSLSAFLLRFARPRVRGNEETVRHWHSLKPRQDEWEIDHWRFCNRLHDCIAGNLFNEWEWDKLCELKSASPEVDLHETTNAFLPPSAYAGAWFRGMLERVLAEIEAEERTAHDDGAHAGRPGPEGVFQAR
jgi:radical SAM superfamily enzyme YgiQ (UPF0313 family)